MLYISQYCKIKDCCCTLNGNEVLRATSPDVRDFLSSLYRKMQLDYPKFFKMDLLAKSGFLTSELLLKDIDNSENAGESTGLFIANASSSEDCDRNFFKTLGDDFFPSPAVFVYTLPNIMMGEICIKHKIFGENTFFVSQIFDAGKMFHYLVEVFKSTSIKRAVAGWVECTENKCEVILMLVDRNKSSELFNIDNIERLWKS